MNADPNSPSDKTASLRVPAVPNEYVKKRLSWWLVLSYSLVLLVLISSLWGISVAGKTLLSTHTVAHSPSTTHQAATPMPAPTPRATSQAATPMPVPSQAAIPIPQIGCSNPPIAATNDPALFFCSPTYMGNVAGPFGVPIVLIGENFSALPTQWFIPKHALKSNDPLVQCSPDNTNSCQTLPPPNHKVLKQGTFLFSWIWQNYFPNDTGNYTISAQVGTQLITTPIPTDFTLLSKQAPCIIITQGRDSTDCATQRLSFHQGDILTIQGKNWLLGWDPQGTTPLINIQIKVIATCVQAGTCSTPTLFDTLVNSKDIAHDGSFSVRQSHAINAKGLYTVSAWNITNDTGNPGGSTNTAADHTLLFGTRVGDLLVQVQ